MSATDDLLKNNGIFATSFRPGPPTGKPAKAIAIVTCMDARIDPQALLGLEPGDAHVLRNAGGVITAGEIRSLTVSQRLFGTREIMLIHHTGCGMSSFTDEQFRQSIEDDVGLRPDWSSEAFTDPDASVRESIARIKASPFIPHTDRVRGFVYDVGTGRLREVR